MLKKNYVWMMALACATMLFGSCALQGSEDRYAYVQAVGYKAESEGKTGMMNLNGEVICEPMFKNEVTEASCDRFFAKSEEGLWELYTLEAQPKRVGNDSYADVGAFVEGLCPVTKRNSWPVYINVDGQTVFEMKEYKGKRIVRACIFQDGMAAVENEDDLWGFIDKKGNMVIEPQFESQNSFYYGKTILFKPLPKGKDEDSKVWVALDTKGNELFTSKIGKYKPQLSGFEYNDLTVVSTKGGHKHLLMNSKGENGAELKINYVHSLWGDLIHYTDDDYYDGLMNTKGEVVMEPTYKDLKWKGGPIIGQNKDESEFYVLNEKGEELKMLEASKVWLPDFHYIGYKDRLLCYTDSTGGYWADANGNKLETCIPFQTATGDHMVVADSEYEIVNLFLKKANLAADGVMGLKLGDKASSIDDDDYPLLKGRKEDSSSNDELHYEGRFMTLNYEFDIEFDEKVLDDDYNRSEKSSVCGFLLSFDRENDKDGTELFEALKTVVGGFAKLEKTTKSFDRGELYKDKDDNYFFIVKKDEQVGILYGYYALMCILAD